MSVRHSPQRYRGRKRAMTGNRSPSPSHSAPHLPTQSVQPTPSHLMDKTLPVDDTDEVDDIQGTSDRAVGSESASGSRSSSDISSDMAYCKGGPNQACGVEVKDNDMGVGCNTCGQWFHIKCQGISEAAYNAMDRYKVFSWHCAECKPGLGHS